MSDSLTRSHNIQVLLSLGTAWAKLLAELASGRYPRYQLVFRLRELRAMFSSAYDKLSKQLSVSRGTKREVARYKCHMSTCPDCSDKFLCLTENIVSIVRCRRCGLKWFYVVKESPQQYSGSTLPVFPFTEPEPIVGGRDACALAIVGGDTCPDCGHVDEYHDYDLGQEMCSILKADLARQYGPNSSPLRLRNDATSFPLDPRRFENRGLSDLEERHTAEHTLNVSYLVRLTRLAKMKYAMSMADFCDLLSPEPSSLRGVSWYKFTSKKMLSLSDPLIGEFADRLGSKEGREAILHELASRWMYPPRNFEEGLSIRDRGDPSEKAHDILTTVNKDVVSSQVPAGLLRGGPERFIQEVFGGFVIRDACPLEDYLSSVDRVSDSAHAAIEAEEDARFIDALRKVGFGPVPLNDDGDCDE